MLNGLNQMNGPSRLETLSGRFDAKAFFAGGKSGFAYDPFDLTTLYQDDLLTTPYTALGQQIGGIKDISGNGWHMVQATALKRPTMYRRPIPALRNLAYGSGDVGNATYWPSPSTQSAITATKIDSGVDVDGLPYIDLQFTASNTTGGYTGAFYNFALTRTPAIAAQVWTCSLVTRQIGGSLTNVSGMRAFVVEETAPSTNVNSTNGNLVTASVDTVSTASGTIATGNQVRVGINLNCSTGVAIDVTYRVKGVQLELAAARSAYQDSRSQYEWYEAGYTSLTQPWYDGANTGLRTSGTVTWGAATQALFAAGFWKMSDAAIGCVMESNNNVNTVTNEGFRMTAPQTVATANIGVVHQGGLGIVNAQAAGRAAPYAAVTVGLSDLIAPLATIWVNGALVTTSNAATGTTGYIDAQASTGARAGGSSQWLTGPINREIARGGSYTAADIAAVTGWINSGMRAY